MRLLRSWGLGAGAAVALCVTATAAVGQAPPPPSYPECTKKPTPADVEGAKGAHKAASQFYERGEYEKAIRYWNDAYAFDCTANDLLLNIANAYEKLGDRASTVMTLETYLQRTGPNPTLEQRVKNLKLLMAAAPPTASAAPTATAAPTPAPTASAAPTAPPPPENPGPYGVKPWFVVGGGAALAIVGAILLPVGYGAIAGAEKTCPDHANCNDPSVASKGNTGRIEAGAGWGLLSLGIAAVGGGMVWQLLYNKPSPAAPEAPKTGLWLKPAAGPQGGGITLGGQF